jgi:DNA-binding IclR family transcriptional regulator
MIRMTDQQPSAKALSIIAVMLQDPQASHRGLTLCAEAGIPAGTSYLLLSELEEIGWVVSEWDSRRPGEGSERPRRRLYRLTALGEKSRHPLPVLRRPPQLGFCPLSQRGAVDFGGAASSTG